MVAPLFLGFLLLMAAIVVALCARYLGKHIAVIVTAGLALWFLYVGILGYTGILANASLRPPGIAFIVIPALLFVLFLGIKSKIGARAALTIPLWILLATQTFRIGVELFLHHLGTAGLAPKMLTFEGGNLEIYIAATAPLIAWFSTRSPVGQSPALVWNLAGLCTLTNVVARALLTAPGPFNLLHTDPPNLFIGTFPFMFIPAFFVPLALLLHLLALRALLARRHSRS